MSRPTLSRLRIVTTVVLGIAASAFAGWEPERFASESTLDVLTVGAKEGEHWSRLWLVVIDDELYVRLGSQAAQRFESNTAPFVAVRIGGEELGQVRAEPVPQMAERVAAAMAEKYWTDLFVRYFPHPLTVRLVPQAVSH